MSDSTNLCILLSLLYVASLLLLPDYSLLHISTPQMLIFCSVLSHFYILLLVALLSISLFVARLIIGILITHSLCCTSQSSLTTLIFTHLMSGFLQSRITYLPHSSPSNLSYVQTRFPTSNHPSIHQPIHKPSLLVFKFHSSFCCRSPSQSASALVSKSYSALFYPTIQYLTHISRTQLSRFAPLVSSPQPARHCLRKILLLTPESGEQGKLESEANSLAWRSTPFSSESSFFVIRTKTLQDCGLGLWSEFVSKVENKSSWGIRCQMSSVNSESQNGKMGKWESQICPCSRTMREPLSL
jgi:hypothetical protein